MFRNALLFRNAQRLYPDGEKPGERTVAHPDLSCIPKRNFAGDHISRNGGGDLIANSIVIEQVFGIPGLGRTLISSISNRDYPVVEAVIVLIAAVILILNTVVDLLYRALDKRIVL